jgi:hypothetical protein
MKRKAISKKTRFEIFKRDGFTCQYCGATPPGALLQVDHIKAVAAGGTNDPTNFVTSCQPCNLGKGSTDLDVVPRSLADMARETEEREAQILGYQQVMERRRLRIEEELWRVAEVIETGSSELGMSRQWTSSIRRFNERLGVHLVLEAAHIARGKYTYGGKRTFLYFCGICWAHIRRIDEEANQ